MRAFLGKLHSEAKGGEVCVCVCVQVQPRRPAQVYCMCVCGAVNRGEHS